MAVDTTTTTSGQDESSAQRPPSWGRVLAPYARPDLRRSLLDVLTSAVAFVVVTGAMYALLDVSYWLVLALSVPAAGFLLRTYILFHDCTHGSLMPTKRANRWLGIALGLMVFSEFESWKHNHQVHHATSGDLDRRGVGDLPTLTVAEYEAMSAKGRLGYRLFRNPIVMFGLGWIWALVIQPRLTSRTDRPRIRRSIILTNVALVAYVAAQMLVFGWQAYLLVTLPVVFMAGATGVWLFYVQHQFEDAYWESSGEWSYADAALRGSSYLKLPKVLQFFTGNIGLHHVHHLSSAIPNYRLQRAHDENPVFHDVPVLTFMDGMRATRLKLWDPQRRRLVTWAEAAQPIA
jgi:acyl-lipid omega-6 desaturase (Delta-12 desaturase)